MGFSFFVEMQFPYKTAQNPISCIILANLPPKNILPKNPNLRQRA
jgi:hypothetical protein